MSTEIIVGLVAIALLTLISIAIAIQTIEKNNKEKRRLENALQSRVRSFDHMLSSLPSGLLSNDLKMLVCKSLLQVYEQLQQLQPKITAHKSAANAVNNQLEELKAAGNSAQVIPELNNPAQIKEVQQDLTALFNFIARLRANNRISDSQAHNYATQIRRLMLKTSLDLLNEQARQALQVSKLKLAVHHYHTAVEKIRKENESEYFKKHLNTYASRIAEIEQQIQERDEQQQARIDKNKDAWDEALSDDKDPWKKNTVYD
jgi:hypothetical protein